MHTFRKVVFLASWGLTLGLLGAGVINKVQAKLPQNILKADVIQSAKGVLRGKVNLHILCVDNSGPSNACRLSAGDYLGRKIIVYDSKTKVAAKETAIERDGTFEMKLEPGDYVLDITHTSMERIENLPQIVTIKSGSITPISIDVFAESAY